MDMQSHDMMPINLDEMSTRERIMITTIRLIERDGVHGLTTRTISREANVNIAAINYYFSSKQKLIEESLQLALNHMFSDTSDIISKKGETDANSLLRNVMFYFIEGSVRYPGIIKAMLHEPINNNKYDGVVMQQILQFIKGLISQADQFVQGDGNAVKARLLQIISVSLMPALLPELFRMILGEDFNSNTEKQRQYIDEFFAV
jgi:AcrR family transcriptional regulator